MVSAPIPNLIPEEQRAPQVVRVEYQGPQDTFADTYANVTYRIPKGSQGIVPYEAACLWFGNPNAINRDESRRDRDEELARMKLRYGCGWDEYDGIHNLVQKGEDRWQETKPQVRVISIDGQEIEFVLHDEQGVKVTPAQQSIAERDLLQSTIAKYEAEMAAMRQQLDALIRAGDQPKNLTPDTPPSDPTRSSQPRQDQPRYGRKGA